MQSIKRDLAIGVSASALVFACALAWGSPFVGANSKMGQEQQQPQQTQPQQTQPDQAQPQQGKSATFTGTVVKDGDGYTLRESSGQMYKLDNPESAKAYEGKPVKVTGQLDEQAKLIHVESIESSVA